MGNMKPLEDEFYVYMSMDGMMWLIFEVLLTFEKLDKESENEWEGVPIRYKNLDDFCEFLLLEHSRSTFQGLRSFRVKLQDDYIEYDILDFVKIHRPEWMI